MAPSRPKLKPLQTPKTMTFPSELLDSPLSASSPKSEHEEGTTTITPPPSYTEFLRILTPIYGTPTDSEACSPRFPIEKPGPSPISLAPSAASPAFSFGNLSKNRLSAVSPRSPYSAPQSAKGPGRPRQLHIPAPFIYSPTTASPKSAYSIRSPYSPSEWRRRYTDSPRVEEQSSVVRQVSTTTITFKRTPKLNPPPEGKRRRTSQDHDSKPKLEDN